jgi:glycopeptide antibiotics resistance protein
MITRNRLQNISNLFFWIWSASIVLVSISPGASVGSAIIGEYYFRLDYPLHAIAFIPLPVLSWIHRGCSRNIFNNSGYRLTILFCFVLAIVAETLQIFVPTRTFNPLDIVSNSSGVVLGLITVAVLSRRRFPHRFMNNPNKNKIPGTGNQ